MSGPEGPPDSAGASGKRQKKRRAGRKREDPSRHDIFCGFRQRIHAISCVSTNFANKMCYVVRDDRGRRQTATAVRSSASPAGAAATRAAARALGD